MKNDATFEISLGDVPAEITEEALRFARNEEEANIAAANIVTDLLRNSEPFPSVGIRIVFKSKDRAHPTTQPEDQSTSFQ